MRYKEIIEAFNNPYKGKWEKSDYGDVDLNIKLPDGTPLSIMFNQEYDGEGEEVIQVEFHRNNSQDVTGEGDAQRIFATVLDAIQKYIKKYKPQKLSFSASKSVDMDADDVEQFNPESRAKLYTRLVQRYAGAWGYQSQHSDEGDVVIYQLTRAQGVAEAEIDEGVHDPHIFKCIFLFGPMGAGKSTVASPLLSHTGLRSVNLDNFNEMFVKKGQVPTGHLAPDQLEKSWQLSQTQQNNFADGRLGIIIDGSGRNPNTAINVIETLAPLGYEFMMIFVNVSEATSIARQQSRAAKQQQQWGAGRQVDPILAKNTYTQVQNNLGKYYAYFGPERFVYVDNENTPDLTQATKKVDAFLRAPVKQPEALEWIKAQKGGQQVTQQQQKLATAQTRQQQALKQFNPLNPKFARQGMAENKADGINKMFNNLGDPVFANLQRVALLAMQGRQSEAAGRLQTVIKGADPAVQKKIIDAVNNIKPVTINGRVADSSTLDKSKQHNDWIINTFIPWVQSLLGKQGVAEDESNDTAISLSKLGKFHPGTDTLAEFVPERATARYALHPDKWESTFYSLTNKDSDKLKYYGPKKISIPPGTLVGDMAIANKFYRAKTPEEQEQYAELYKASLQPYPVDVSQYRMPELLIPKQGVAEGLDDNGISFQVQKGKNKFATTLSVGGDPVGVYQYDANTGRSIAEIYPEFKGKGLGKLLVLHAIYTAANLGLDFQEDESRTSEYDNVLDSLSSNGYIVDDDGYWYVTGDGEQYLKQSLKQDVVESQMVEFEGVNIRVSKESYKLKVEALDDWGNKVLGYVEFNIGDGKELDPQDLRVDDKYQGQGIARTMYDFVKKLGYEIHRSWDQTDAGKGFWDKHRGEEQRVWENFHDGKNPQDKGDSKRHGVPTKASISTLRKVAKQGGRKGQLAHWMANMKSGRAKAKRK